MRFCEIFWFVGFLFFLPPFLFPQNSPKQQENPLTVKINAEPKNYSGICPATIKFIIEFATTSISPITVKYQFFYSDGAKKGDEPNLFN